MKVERTKHYRSKENCQIQYIAKEGNQLADFFTNYAFGFVGTVQFHNFQKVPTQARRITR